MEDDSGTTALMFTVDRTGDAQADQTFNYTFSVGDTDTDDFTPDLAGGSVVFAQGVSSQTVTVQVQGDATLEGDETFTIDLVDAADGSNTASGTGTITNDDGVSLSTDDVTVTEDVIGGNAVFTVELSGDTDIGASATYTVVAGTADGTDITIGTGTVTFAAGSTDGTTQSISVPVIDDDVLEGTENFTVVLSAPSTGVTLADDTGTGTISDDDSAQVTITATDASGSEPGNDGLFTVSLSNASATDTVVAYSIGGDATADSDYTALTGTVTILAGETSATIDVEVLDDSLLEDDESVTVTLDSVTSGDDDITIGAANSDTVTIADDGDAAPTVLSVSSPTEIEGTSLAFTVTLTGSSATTHTQSIAVADFTTIAGDYGAVTYTNGVTELGGVLTIPASVSTFEVQVAGAQDTLVESSESFTVTVGGVAGTGTISDDDSAQVTITATDASGSEPGNDGLFTVSLSNASATDTVVAYSIGGDATAGSDYTALTGTVTILAGETSATIDVEVLDDSLLEDDETVTVTLDSVTSGDDDITIGAANSDTVTIADDDTATVSIAGTTDGDEAGPVNGVFTVSLDQQSDTATTVSYTVAGTSDSGDDFTALTGTVTIPANTTNAVISVPVIDDALLEGNETLQLTLGPVTSGDGDISVSGVPASINIIDNDVASLSVADVTVAEDVAAGNLVFTVTLSTATASGFDVDYSFTDGTATGGTDYDNSTGTLNFTGTAGETQTITVPITNDDLFEGDETFTVNLSTTASVDDADTAIGTITDDDSRPTITVDSPAVVEGDSGTTALMFTVDRTGDAQADQTFNYTFSAGDTDTDDFTPDLASGSVVFAQGVSSQTMTVQVQGDTTLEGDETFTIDLVDAADGSNTASGTGTITNNDGVSLSTDDVTVTEDVAGGNAVFTVELSGDTDIGASATYTVVAGTADGTDITIGAGTVTFAAGSTDGTTQSISVPVIDDDVLEGTENFTVVLSAPSTGVTLVDDTGSGTITDEDTAQVTIVATDASGSEPVVTTVCLPSH